jgi:hypothetical protein
LDFGYGLSPGHQEYTVPMLVVAWDCYIQLVLFDENDLQIKADGFYVSESEISTCYFVGDSILMVLLDQTRVKLLYTKRFHHGDSAFLESHEFQRD